MNVKELTTEQLTEEICAIIEERLGVAAADITPEKNLINAEEAAENIKTVGDIINYVKAN